MTIHQLVKQSESASRKINFRSKIHHGRI